MNKIKILKGLIVLILTIFSFYACDEGGDPDPGATTVVDVAGEWYVQFLVDGVDVYNIGYALISTYNTSANTNEIWIDDNQNTWWFKVKVPVDLNSKTFSGSSLASSVDGYDITVDITNGMIVENGTTTSGGNTADSISFDAVFSDDPTTTYQLIGYKRTGFLEDEH